MAHRLKNLSAIPYDISTLSGPAILPANGEITVDLSAFEIEVMHHSPDIEISEADPLDHDKNGKKGGSTAAESTDDLDRLRAEYKELAGKKAFSGWKADRLQSEIDKLLAA